MTHKHKGLSYTLKKLDSKGKAGKALRMQVLRCVLAVGFALSPWLGGEAFADAGIVRMDNTQYLDGTSTVADIYPEKIDTDYGVGLNRFQKFMVENGQTANLYFKTEPNGSKLNYLINTVNDKISIDGIVNAVYDSSSLGKLYFLSANGMVVGPNGVINAGNLTVLTLQQHMIDGINNSGTPAITAYDTVTYPEGYEFDSGAHIDIYGKIIAQGCVDLRSGFVVK